MSELTCKIVGDLLPLYVDDLVSPETRQYVEGHLRTCTACQRILADMRAVPVIPLDTKREKVGGDSLVAAEFAGRLRKRMITIWSLMAFLVIVIAGLLVGYLVYVFQAPRPFQAWINTFVNPTPYHVTYSMDETARLPLPPKTAFRFRTAQDSATNFTRLSEQEVVEHFRDVSSGSGDEPEASSTAGEVRLRVVYAAARFEVTIMTEEKGCLFRVTTLERGP